MKPPTDDQRKRLTEYCPQVELILAEEYRLYPEEQNILIFAALKDKLVENGEWEDFFEYAYRVFEPSMMVLAPEYDATYSSWLFRLESCGLVAEYLEQKEGK
jgi:hypothetical protein